MSEARITETWAKLVAEQSTCEECRLRKKLGLVDVGGSELVDHRAKPLFGRFDPWKNGLLFVFEAPNLEDTIDPAKGYLTYDQETDPTGRFARVLMTEELGLAPQYFQVTNSVLCLPRSREGKFPVSAKQAQRCAARLREQIEVLAPAVVVSVGAKALDSLKHIEKHGLGKISEVVATPRAWFGRWLFPVYHTGQLARNAHNGRPESLQREDWRKLRLFMDSKGVRVPG